MANHSIYIGEIEITPREILFSVIILSLMIGLGVWISNPILRKVNEAALNTESCVKVDDAEKFGYIKRTNAGEFLAEGKLSAIDSVSIPDIPGYYMAIKRDKERYTMHTETYTTTDSKGHTTVHTRTYWTWDVVHTDRWTCDSLLFLNQRFSVDDIKYHFSTIYNTTIKKSSDIRYVYYTHPSTVYGVMRGVADNKSFESLSFQEDMTINKTLERAEKKIKASPIVFFVFWSIFAIFVVIGFFAIENTWLED